MEGELIFQSACCFYSSWCHGNALCLAVPQGQRGMRLSIAGLMVVPDQLLWGVLGWWFLTSGSGGLLNWWFLTSGSEGTGLVVVSD